MKRLIIGIVFVMAVAFIALKKEQPQSHFNGAVPNASVPTNLADKKDNVSNSSAPKASRGVASVVEVTNNTAERALILELINVTRQAENNSSLQDKVDELRRKLKALPNKRQVLWDYYRDLQVANAAAFQRVEALDLLNGSGKDTQLAEVALAEALDFSPEPVIRPEQARTQDEMNTALSTDPSFIPVQVAFDIYLNNCGTYATCQQGLLTVIANNENHNMRANLIANVNKRFPKDRDQFSADLSRYKF